jgi:hypothetical protein
MCTLYTYRPFFIGLFYKIKFFLKSVCEHANIFYIWIYANVSSVLSQFEGFVKVY